VVDLDADLEADLGIDSIKKAQMFGELQEYFPDVVQPREDLTLDDFPTLRHVLNFLRGEMEQPALQPAEPVVAAVEVTTTAEATASPPMPVPSLIESAPAKHSAIDPAQLESFLVNFVVEQTGYPPDVVDVDADLEADLGIDSIKKAQMFGELQEYFPDVVQPREDLTLDDFPTLRHVLNFLRGEMPAEADPVAEPAALPLESPPAAEEGWDAASEAIAQPQPAAAASAPPQRIDPTQLEAFLVNFVVEQTGYPADVVDLDADLEADLGIDSIKKAQMFGELQEYFPDVVQPREDVTLDDFPTLRHVLNFLRGEMPAKPTAGVAVSTNQRHAANGDVADEEPPAEMAALTLRLSGSPYEMGLAHGRELQSQIRHVLRYYADLADETLDELPLAELRSDPSQLFSAEELEEMRGIAEGAGVPQGNIIAHNLALLADLGVSTTQLVVPGNRSTAMMHALEEPLPLVAGLREELLPIVQVRQRVDSVPHALCSFAGLVFGLSGINAAGLTVSSGSLAGQFDVPSKRSGRLPALLVGELLASAADIDAAVEVARQFESRTAWNACITDSTSGRVYYLEYDGSTLDVRQPAEAIFAVSANGNGSIASADRLRKLSDMLDSSSELSSAAGVRQALARCGSSRENGFSHGGLALEAAHAAEDPVLHVIMQPSARQLWLGGIGPANGSLLSVRLEELGDRGAPAPLAEEAALKKKGLSRTRPR
jgi:acyl carrier protein